MYKKILACFSVVVVSSVVSLPVLIASEASTSKPVSGSVAEQSNMPTINEAAVKAIVESNTGLKVGDIKASSIPGFVVAFTEEADFYVSNDATYLFNGKVYKNTGSNGLVELKHHSDKVVSREDRLKKARLAGIKQFEDSMIEYPAENEKHVISVFTDITCGYCLRLHSQMAEYNKLGITVRYLAYPRAGIERNGKLTKPFKDLRSIWCSDDPAKALTKAKTNRGSPVPYRVCDVPIDEQYIFGTQIGVSGTPAMILSNGDLIPGYQDPQKLLASLEQK